jgi:hypothetical protein
MASHRSEGGLDVRGGATDEEIAAILAVLGRRRERQGSPYAVWRATRIAALAKRPY